MPRITEMIASVAKVTGKLALKGTKAGINQARTIVFTEPERQQLIEAHRDDWGDRICDLLLEKDIVIGMTEKMVEVGLGSEYVVDQREVLKTGTVKHRWRYGEKWNGATYVYFKHGLVTKFKRTARKKFGVIGSLYNLWKG